MEACDIKWVLINKKDSRQWLRVTFDKVLKAKNHSKNGILNLIILKGLALFKLRKM